MLVHVADGNAPIKQHRCEAPGLAGEGVAQALSQGAAAGDRLDDARHVAVLRDDDF